MPCLICRLEHRIPERGQVCEGCRNGLAGDLTELVDAYAALSAEPSRRAGERISGTRERPLPAKVTVLDLTLHCIRRRAICDPYGDQIGHIPVVETLDGWVEDWIEHRSQGENHPPPTVPALADWLRTRLDWACDEFAAIAEYASEIRTAIAACRAAMGDIRDDDTVTIGPCPAEMPGGIECGYRLRADPYVDNITCRRCQTVWPKRNWLWIHDRHSPTEFDERIEAC